MKEVNRVLVVGICVVAAMLTLTCSKTTGPANLHDFPAPLDAVAENITLTIYSDGWGTLLQTTMLATEGDVVIDVEETNPYFDPPRYYIYADADGFYTELYQCTKGDAITVDLDGVPQVPNSVTGVIIARQTYFADTYLTDQEVWLKSSQGNPLIATNTDAQGRYGIAGLPGGEYTVNFSYEQMPFQLAVTNSNSTDYSDLSFWGPTQERAPYLYLYPESEQDIRVRLGFSGGGYVYESEPPYCDGWDVRVRPDGTIDGMYRYLFYEALVSKRLDHDLGWLISGHGLEADLRGLLSQLGLIGAEIDDFLQFWVPILEGHPWYAFYPQDAEALITLDITPQPKTVIRALFLIRPLERPVAITAPPIPSPPKRDGFTAVEWGVIGWID